MGGGVYKQGTPVTVTVNGKVAGSAVARRQGGVVGRSWREGGKQVVLGTRTTSVNVITPNERWYNAGVHEHGVEEAAK